MAVSAYKTSSRSRRTFMSTFGSRTDIGCVREHNEDSLIVKPPLFVVADGMGGHAAGEVASEIAVRTVEHYAPEHPDAEALGEAVELANRAIINAALTGKGREGMGTTCTAAMLEGSRLVIAQVGDSRAYLLHAGKLMQITRDHSLMADMIDAGQITPEEARTHPNRSVITRALGNDPDTVPDLYEVTVETGDRLLLCSDGLTSMLRDVQIERIMNRASDPQRCAAQLVNEAIAAGGLDNVTVIVADAEGSMHEDRKEAKRHSHLTAVLVLLLLAVIVGGAIWGANQYLGNSAYLANDNGKVALYRGVPGNVLGFTYSEHVITTEIELSALTPSAAERINQNLRVDNMDDAWKLIESYRQDIAISQANAAALTAGTATAGTSSNVSNSAASSGTTASDGAASASTGTSTASGSSS